MAENIQDKLKARGIDTAAIVDGIRANNKLLNSCRKPHQFERDPSKPLGDRTCKLCGGKISAVNSIWYNRGVEDGKK